MWRHARSGPGLWALVLILGIVALLAVPLPADASAAAAAPSASAPPPQGSGAGAIGVNFSYADTTPIQLSNIFWGTSISPRARLLPEEGDLINATPTQIVVWPGANAGEHFDPLNDTFWKNGHTTGTPLTNESQFVAWCRSIRCEAILQVPGEIDSPSYAAEIVEYTTGNGTITIDNAVTHEPEVLHDLDFQPAYWEIGNEPELWTCWQLPWTEWGATNCESKKNTGPETPTPQQYAEEVAQYIPAMRAVDPTIRFIGIPATGRANGPYSLYDWIYNTTLYNGPNLSGVAFHEYPVSKSKIEALDQFYGAITNSTAQGASDLLTRDDQVERAIYSASVNNSCTTCYKTIKVFVTEIGSGLSHGANSIYVQGFPGALSLAAQMTEAMDLNITNLDLFAAVLGTSNSWFNFTGEVRPDYTMYSEILNHLGTTAYPVSFTTSPQYCVNNLSLCDNLYGIGTIDPAHGDRSDLLLVNLNTTYSATFGADQLSLPGVGSVADHPLEVWTWGASKTSVFSPATPSPVATYYPNGLPAGWELANQSVAVFESYPQGGVQVDFSETGFTPNNTTGPRWFMTVDGVFEEANATRTISYFLPEGDYTINVDPIPMPLNGKERIELERLEPFVPSTLSVGASAFNVTVPFVLQWNYTTAEESGLPPDAGFVSPGPGWVNASTPITVTAHPGYDYVFTNWIVYENHTGEVVNAPWRNVEVLGYNSKGQADAWLNETWNNYTDVGFTNDTGLTPTISPYANGSLVITAEFARAYPVTFVENGLPAGTDWSVTTHGTWNDTDLVTYRQDNNVQYYANGTKQNNSYWFTWTNTSVTDVLSSEPVRADITSSSMISDLSVTEANGTYGFSIPSVPGYRSLPVGANFTVHGGALTVYVNFTPTTPPPPEYPVTFVETGLPSGSAWSIDVRNQTVASTGPTLQIAEPSGAYGYVATTIAGYHARNASYGFYVNNSSLVVTVSFYQVMYAVVWEETGLGNLSWSVDVAGDPVLNNGAWTTDPLPNGTYAFTIPDVEDYVPDVHTGNFSIEGVGRVFYVEFLPASFRVTFQASGLPADDAWSVRVSDNLLTETAGSASFLEPNGTYTYNVTPPTGYTASPSHGVLTVDAAPTVVDLSFQPIGLAPTPPVWNLAIPALVATGAIALAGWGSFVLVGRRRRRRRPGAKS